MYVCVSEDTCMGMFVCLCVCVLCLYLYTHISVCVRIGVYIIPVRVYMPVEAHTITQYKMNNANSQQHSTHIRTADQKPP